MTSSSGTTGQLARRLTLVDATTIGLGSMIGAGIFAAFAPAAAAAGGGLFIGLLVAAFVAYCNATSSAQLAARYPTSGGTYVYGREQLGPWPGYLAGWGFVVGKTASAAAMALTVATYLVPDPWRIPVALVAVWGLALVNLRGITRTAQLTRLIVALVLVVLAALVVANLTQGNSQRFTELAGANGGVYGILQSAGLLFFAFAGYARIATMGEEVIEPRRTIPRAITIALVSTVALYAIVAVSLVAVLGIEGIAATPAPLAAAAEATGWPGLPAVVRVGAALAALGALLAALTGLGRTSLAMAREGDLPRPLAQVDPVHQVPRRAELVIAIAVSLLVLVGDLRGVIGFSSFGVLLYYTVANASAYTQGPADRRYPKVLQVLGMVGCLVLVATLPWQSGIAGVGVFAVGIGVRAVRLRLADRAG